MSSWFDECQTAHMHIVQHPCCIVYMLHGYHPLHCCDLFSAYQHHSAEGFDKTTRPLHAFTIVYSASSTCMTLQLCTSTFYCHNVGRYSHRDVVHVTLLLGIITLTCMLLGVTHAHECKVPCYLCICVCSVFLLIDCIQMS